MRIKTLNWFASSCLTSQRLVSHLLRLLSLYTKGFLEGIYEEDIANEVNEIEFEHASKTFSASFFLVVSFLELINVTHSGGSKEVFGYHFVINNEGRRKPNWPIMLLSLLKVGVLLFCATLFKWSTDPHLLSGVGCAAVFILSVTRELSKYFINRMEGVNTSDDSEIDLVVTESVTVG